MSLTLNETDEYSSILSGKCSGFIACQINRMLYFATLRSGKYHGNESQLNFNTLINRVLLIANPTH